VAEQEITILKQAVRWVTTLTKRARRFDQASGHPEKARTTRQHRGK